MGLLDFDEHYKPPYRPPKKYYTRSEEENLHELNNLGHGEVAEDFSGSSFANRVDNRDSEG